MEPSTRIRKIQIKNRRYQALEKLVDTTDYFTEEEMQRRNPILYNQLIGRYHTKEERETFLLQSYQSSSVGISGPNSKPTPLTDMLIAHMNRLEGICSDRRIEQEHQVQEEKQADREYSTLRQKSNSNSFSKDSYDINGSTMDENTDEENEDNMEDENEHENESITSEIDEAEKDLLKEEFFTTMYRHFLDGKDEDFEYEDVDNNPDYDVGETLDQDEEEKYFDAEEPENLLGNDIKEDGRDIENRMDDMTLIVNGEPTCSILSSTSMTSTSNISTIEGDEEDELDCYMRAIEMEIKRQNSVL